jgi:phytoene dehydrogenase-like protein
MGRALVIGGGANGIATAVTLTARGWRTPPRFSPGL